MTETSLQKWQTISSRDVIVDMPWLRLSADHVRLPNGKDIERFYRVNLPEYVVVVAVTRERLVILERQYKHAVGKVVLNLPAGYIEDCESPLDCAKRELLEETGFSAESWQHLGSFWVDGNRGCGKVHVFAVSDAEKIADAQNSDDTEEVEVILTGPQDALQLLMGGEIATSGAALALSLAFLSPCSPLCHTTRKQ